MKKLLVAILLLIAFPAFAQKPPINGVAGPTTSAQFGSIITNPFGSPSTGDRMLFATPHADCVLLTDGSSNPLCSTTLPSGLNIVAPSLTGNITGTANGGTGGNFDALVTGSGLKSTIAISQLASGSGGATTIPWDLAVNVAAYNPSGDSDYRTFRNISEFFDPTTNNANKIYGQYQGLKFSGVGVNTVDTTYNFHGFTWLNGATSVNHLRGIFHHIPMEGTGGITDALDFEAGANVFTSTGTIVTMTGFQASDIGGSQVHSAVGFHAVDTTVDTNSAFTISSGTYNNTTGVITLTVSPNVTVGLSQNVTLSGLTGTGAFASLNGAWPTIATTYGNTITLQATAALGASTVTGGTATVPLGNVIGFLAETTGPTNYAIKTTGNAVVQFGGAQIQVGNVTWQGTQTSLSQNYTMARSMGAVAGVNTGLTNQTLFSASNTNADVRGLAVSVLPSGSTAISNVIGLPISITTSATATTTQMIGASTNITLQAANNVTTGRGFRTAFQLSSSGGMTTATGYLADAPTLSSTGAITNVEGFTASQIGDASLVTTAKGFRMLDTSAVTSVEAFAGEVTSGTGKWNISVTGSANNRVAGSTTFGATTVPTKTVDITGTLGASGTSSLADAVITSPSATALAVGLAGATNPAFQVDASTASQAAGLKLTGAATGGTVALAAIDSGSTTGLTISAKGGGTLTLGSGTNVVTVGRPLGVSGAITVTSSSSTSLAVGPTGATSPVLAVNSSGTPGVTMAAAAIVMSALASDATHTDATLCKDTTSNTLLVGSGAAGICLGTSSLRFKTDVHPLQLSLAQIDALQPISYRYKPGYGTTDRDLYGFAAEQMYQVMPELVGLDKDGRPNSVDWAGVVPVLVNAIKELKADNDNLALEVTKLKKVAH